METLISNSVEMTAAQLLNVTEGLAWSQYKRGVRSTPRPTEEDIWDMLLALNFTLWLCPNTGHQAIKLLHEKWSLA